LVVFDHRDTRSDEDIHHHQRGSVGNCDRKAGIFWYLSYLL
jgi:hypothetical protein